MAFEAESVVVERSDAGQPRIDTIHWTRLERVTFANDLPKACCVGGAGLLTLGLGLYVGGTLGFIYSTDENYGAVLKGVIAGAVLGASAATTGAYLVTKDEVVEIRSRRDLNLLRSHLATR